MDFPSNPTVGQLYQSPGNLQYEWTGTVRKPHRVAGAAGIQGPKGDSGADGHSPALTWSGDKIAIDGVASGPSLTGPKGDNGADGHSPVVSVSGDQITVDGVIAGPHLTGPQGVKGDAGDVGPAGTTTWAGITDKPSAFAPSAHTHTTSEVTGLATALAGKAPLDGTGVSGTWAISISGNAAHASEASHAATATMATSASNADTVDNLHAGAAAGNLPILDSNAKIPFAADKIIISANDPDPAQGDQNWLWIKVS